MGVNPISYQEMQSYFSLHKISPDEWEIDAIKMLDGIALKYYADQQEKEVNKSKKK